MNLTGKVVMIVGAGRGIGRSCAELFSKAGANLALASRDEAELFELEYKLAHKNNTEVLALPTDAAIKADVEHLVEEARWRFGRIDTLVYSAGIGMLKPFNETTSQDFDRLFDVNTRGAFYAMQAVLPVMAEQKSGNVVVIPGVLGRAPMASAAAYCAAKYALTGMTKCLALEYKRFGIRFCLMHFGAVDTSFWDNISMRVPSERMMTADDAAKEVFFAATQEGESVLSERISQPELQQL
ncbi:MAG TPA: SDR family oxidoreductase [Pyrinomonadaceae bacterium]|jgi:NAD(P)-dependent dehydrogenase (short-subunit alcohol dehydrogenase family)